MLINTLGASRLVIVLKNIVIKIPTPFNGWHHFIIGILGNITENKCWKWNSGVFEKGHSYLLCPVLWCSWGGWILIMRKADKILTYDEAWERDLSKHIEHFPGDDTGPNYGILNGNIVKIDYGSINSD